MSEQPETMRLHRITRQEAKMMHLACHYFETFLHFETASFRSFGRFSELLNGVLERKLSLRFMRLSVFQSGLKRILIIDIHQPSRFNNKREAMTFKGIHHCWLSLLLGMCDSFTLFCLQTTSVPCVTEKSMLFIYLFFNKPF